MEVERILHMNTGNGETSYAKNSTVQVGFTIRFLFVDGYVHPSYYVVVLAEQNHINRKPVTVEAMEELLTRSMPEIMGIADLGCASGQNTLNVVSEVMDVVYEKYRGYGRPFPELNVFLNDLYSNDFNLVFGLLPIFLHKIETAKGGEFAEKCAIFGAPGSFYGRLFPRKSLHFVHSSSSLHWLSQVPPCLDKEAKEAMNKGEIYTSKNSPPCVLEAYAEQFHADFSTLLKSRSAEMVEGGGMVFSFMGRKSTDPTDESCREWEILAEALMSMALEGLIDEEKVDSFNVPYYAPCKEELEIVIQREGSFILDRYQTFEFDWDGGSADEEINDFAILSSGQRVAKTVQAVTESMLESHFGGQIMDELFKRFEKRVEDHLSKTRAKHINLVISLIRK